MEGGSAYLVTWHPTWFLFFSILYPLLSPLYPLLPSPQHGVLPPSFVVRSVLTMVALRRGLVALAEFQTPTIFDRDFDFNCRSFHSPSKIMKIIIYILYIYGNVSRISIQAISICGFINVIISFQSCRISFYIEIPR